MTGQTVWVLGQTPGARAHVAQWLSGMSGWVARLRGRAHLS